jgi:hypothetical protein
MYILHCLIYFTQQFSFCVHEKSVHMIEHWISPEQIGLLNTVYAVFTRIQNDYPSQSSILMKTPL